VKKISTEEDILKQMILNDDFSVAEIEMIVEKITLADMYELGDMILKQAIEIKKLRKELDELRKSFQGNFDFRDYIIRSKVKPDGEE
jgi:uncharacterized coiled-coil DUF342 family protein